MHSSTIFATLSLSILALAAPTQNTRLPTTLFPRQANGSDCSDFSQTPQPANKLTPPGPDLSLVLIALGKGTQNYTCAEPTAKPAAIGAVADLSWLVNASCAIANNQMGSITEDASAIGAHFFVDSTTPDFDIVGLGNTLAKKTENVTAPNAAADVPWLLLEATPNNTGAVRSVYRLNTQGGVAPETCEGQAPGAEVTVEYSAQYWVYAATEVMQQRRLRRTDGLALD